KSANWPKNRLATSSTINRECSTKPSASRVTSSALGWSRRAAKQLSGNGSNNQVCSRAAREPLTCSPFVARYSAAGSRGFGNTAATSLAAWPLQADPINQFALHPILVSTERINWFCQELGASLN